VYPHPNRLPRWLKPLLLGSGAALLLTGLLWLALHYRAGWATPDTELPHAWEAPLMRLHGLAMLVFLLSLGALTPVHVPRGWRERRSLRSGVALLLLNAALIASGYTLYYFAGDGSRALIGLAHSAVGLLLLLVFALHWRGRYSQPPAP
jgi:hypothetical protein